MNALEQANWLDKYGFLHNSQLKNTSSMLRTIPALEAEIEQKQKQIELHKNAHHQAVIMNNELHAEIEALKMKHDAIACSSCVCGFIKRGKAQE